MLYLIWAGVIVTAIVLFFKKSYSHFRSRGVKHLPPAPFFGNMARLVLQKEHWKTQMTRFYYAFPDEKFIGMYTFFSPMVILRDLDLIKQVVVKDFEHFLNHGIKFDAAAEPLFGRNLFFLRDEDWKDMRATLSPAFTSSKIRLMVPFMVDVVEQMIKFIEDNLKSSKEGYVDLDVKNITTRFANDVIASCAFGLKVNSYVDLNNEFYVKGNQTATFKFAQFIKFFGYIMFPKLMNRLKIPILPNSCSNFFRRIVGDTMKHRDEKHVIRPDVIQLLMEVKKGTFNTEKSTEAEDASAGFATVEESFVGKRKVTRDWSDDDLTAQAVLFFVAGFETISSTTAFLLHELATNPDVQDKLYEEIKETDKKNGGKIEYTVIQGMKYMDMVVSESLRKWPPVAAGDRTCSKDYNLGKPNPKAKHDYIVRKGDGIYIPITPIHYNPEYYPDPEKFIPERFSEENKHKIKPFTYLPFGLGPRNCIGSRFALCEVKTMVYLLLKSVELSPGAKTQIPVELATDTMNIRIKGGHWVRFRPRK